MPRINIEEIWWADPRRARLIEKLNSAFMADGLMTNVWRVSQDFKAEPFRWQDFFEEKHIEAIIGVGLAKINEAGLLCVKGAEEAHKWLDEMREKGRRGGLKSAEKRRQAYGQPNGQPNGQPTVKGFQPSSSSSSSNKKNTVKVPNGTTSGASLENGELASTEKKRAPVFLSRDEFQKVYDQYPKRKNNQPTKAFEKLKTQIKNAEDWERFKRAVEIYAEREKDTDPQYIKQFVNFCSPLIWVDVVEDEPENSTKGAIVVIPGQGMFQDGVKIG